MPLSINTNVASLTAQRSMLNTNQALETSFERLSTGKRVNSSVDDAAGLSIGVSLESDVSGLNQAIRNTNDGISMVQIAEGALDEATTILQRMRDIAVQSNNASMGTNEITYLQAEHDKLAAALDDVLGAAKFNGTSLIGSSDAGKVLQVGAGTTDLLTVTMAGANASTLGVSSGAISLGSTLTAGTAEVVFIGIDTFSETNGDTIHITIGDNTFNHTVADDVADISELVTALNNATITGGTDTMGDLAADYAVSATVGGILITAADVGALSDTNVSLALGTGDTAFDIGAVQVVTQGVDQVAGSTAAITAIDSALDQVASNRASLGASQSQLESTVRNLANVAENTAAAVGRIMDTDYAAETANLTKAQILQQAATSILAQANSQPQSVLALLQ